MKLSIRIAAAKRSLRRMQEARPLFLEGVANYTPDAKTFAIRAFEAALTESQNELDRLKAAAGKVER